MLIFKHVFVAYAILNTAVMTIVGMCSNKGIMYQPSYLAYLKILHWLVETIVLSSIMLTSLSEDCAVCGKVSRGFVPTLYVVWHVVILIVKSPYCSNRTVASMNTRLKCDSR